MSKPRVVCFWFRRDLRLHDNQGLYKALTSGYPVVPVFIFDRAILDKLPRPYDRRVGFIHQALDAIQNTLVGMGGSLDVRYGFPLDCWKKLCELRPFIPTTTTNLMHSNVTKL